MCMCLCACVSMRMCLYVHVYMRVMFVFVSVCMCVLEIPPLVFYPLPYVVMIAVKIPPYIPSMSGGLYTFFKNLPSSPLVRRKHSLLSGYSVAMGLICSRLGLFGFINLT